MVNWRQQGNALIEAWGAVERGELEIHSPIWVRRSSDRLKFSGLEAETFCTACLPA
jgi:hypothetical protein